MSSITNITALQVAQKGNELNFYSKFRTRVPYRRCSGTVIQVGSSWSGSGSMSAVKSTTVGVPNMNCISNSSKRVLTSNISTNNGQQFLGFGYYQTAQDGNIYV
jgi:hypothetical protein